MLKGHRTLVVAPEGTHRDQPDRQPGHGDRRHRRRPHRRHRRAGWRSCSIPRRRRGSASTCTARPAISPAAAVGAPALVAGDVLRYLGAALARRGRRGRRRRAWLTAPSCRARRPRREAVGAELAARLAAGARVLLVRRARRRQDGVRARPRRRPGRRPGRGEQPDVHAGPGVSRAACRCIHVDLYRLAPGEVDDLGLDALAADGVLAIEWAERMPRDDAGAITVRLEHAGEDTRRITIDGASRDEARRRGDARMIEGATVLGVAGIALALAGASASLPAQPAAPDRPNVVLIMTDDAGYGDFGVYGAPDIKTPHIDSLARDGVRLTDFYANGATCTPTRTGLISGRYQQRYALEAPLGVRPKEDAERGLRAVRPLAAAAAEGRRLRHRAGRQVASRLEARVQPERARVRRVLRLQERLHRLLPAHRRQGRAAAGRPVRERQAGRGRGLHDGPDHGSDRAGHRAEPREAVLHRRRLQRAALAVPAARPAVDGARQRPAPARRSTTTRARARTT